MATPTRAAREATTGSPPGFVARHRARRRRAGSRIPVERGREHRPGVADAVPIHRVLDHGHVPLPQRPHALVHGREVGAGQEHDLRAARVEPPLRRHLEAVLPVHHPELIGGAGEVAEGLAVDVDRRIDHRRSLSLFAPRASREQAENEQGGYECVDSHGGSVLLPPLRPKARRSFHRRLPFG